MSLIQNEVVMNELSPDYIALISSTVTVIVTAIVTLLAVWLTNHLNFKHLERKLNFESDEKKMFLIRQRAEELYELADKWLLGLSIHHLNLYAVMQNKINYNEYLQLTIENGKSSDSNFGRLEMILHLYFPELITKYSEVVKVRDTINIIARDFKAFYESKNELNESFIKPFNDEGNNLDKVGSNFKDSIVEYIKTIESK